jgi:selenocysteine-specific elongation factor
MKERVRDFVLGTAGHIDHGKTALVRALTGVDTDRLPAEKQRGITIDLGFASLEVGEYRLAIVDVPGHERFIRNMLAGAAGLDLAMLIVAADDSVMPQTREHMEILRLLRLSGGLVVLSKCDLAEPGWLDLVEDDVRTLVRGTFLEGATIVRTSATTGLGLDQLTRALEALCASIVEPGHDTGVFRMAIDRSFTVSGHGTVVTGTIVSGCVTVGDELEWLPVGRPVRVRGLHRHDRPVEQAGRGSRAAINLVGVHHTEILRGQELAAPGYLEPTRILSVEVVGSPGSIRPLRHRGRYKLHMGTAEVPAVLSLLEPDGTSRDRPRLAQLLLAEPIVAIHGQPFVLRAESPPETLGGGRVVQPVSRRYRRRDHTAIERLAHLQSNHSLDRLRSALTVLGLTPCTERRISALTGLEVDQVETGLASLADAGSLVELPLGPRRSARVLVEFAAELEDRILRALARLHAAHPRQSAIPRVHLAAAVPDLANDALVAGILDRLKHQGRVMADARTVALPGHEPRLSQGERRLKETLAEAIRTGGMSPPDASELAASAGSRSSVVPDLLALLRDEHRITEIHSGLYLDADIEAELRRRVRERLLDGSAMTMAELRDLLGTTRRYAVPIGEYLDRISLTRREGDLRRLAGSVPPTTALADEVPSAS